MKGFNKAYFLKVLGVICALCLLVSTIYVPMSFSASAAEYPVVADTAVTFSFEEGEGSANGTGEDGVGLSSWGMRMYTNDDGVTGIGFKHTNSAAGWADQGGYRLNNKDGIYYLDADSTYVVSFKLQVKSGPIKKGSFQADASSTLQLGYGFKNGTDGNPAKAMGTVVSDIYTSASVSEAERDTSCFDLTTHAGVTTYKAGDTWYDLTYVFTTPATFKSDYCRALGFRGWSYHGTEFIIDDVTVTKLGEDKGAVLLVDAYYNTVTAKVGVVGEAVALDELTTENAEHEFIGWYKNEERTETAEGLTFTKETQTVYSAWKAPVTVTFIDTYNNREYTSSGIAGERIEYPEEPVDEQNDPDSIWFMGWFTSDTYTEEFNDEKFDYKNHTVYSKWLSEIPSQTQDFENYTKDERKLTTTTVNGEVLKKWHNRLYFGYAMNKIDDPTNSEKGKVIDFTWDKEMVLDPENPNSYNSNERYATVDNVVTMENIVLEKDRRYTVTFDYFVETLSDDAQVKIVPVSGHPTDIWQPTINFSKTDGAEHIVTASDIDGIWHQASFTFTAQFVSPTSTTIHFLLLLTKNADLKMYVDNVVFDAAQPYQSFASYDLNNGQPPIVYEGNRGEELPDFVPENSGLKFLGWYADKELTIPFTQTKYSYKMAMAYAKWEGTVIEFNNYGYASNRFMFNDLSMSIDKTDGYEDKFSVNWHYDGDKWSPYQKNYVCARDSVVDDMVGLLRLENNKTYELSYYVRVNSANSDFSIRVGSGAGGSVWDGGSVIYPETVVNISADEADKGWLKKSVVFTTNFGTTVKQEVADFIYMYFYTTKKNMDTDVNVSFDQVVITEVKNNLVIFNGNAEGVDTAYQTGAVGDAIVFPTLTNGNAQFLGWYSDAECEVPFTATTIAEGITNAYAKWSAVPETFESYKYASSSHYVFGKNMKVFSEKGTGVDGDDYTLRFDFDGTKIWQTDASGKVTTWNERGAGAVDNIARLGALQNNSIYKITYYYRANEGSNVDANIVFMTCNNSNIWGNGRVAYSGTEQVVTLKTTQWTKAEAIIYTDFADPSYNMLYIGFGANGKVSGNMRIIVDVDNVLIEKIDKPYVYFDGQTDTGYAEYCKGVAGGEIILPANPTKFGYDFVGWYLDKECTVPFTQTVFGENDKLVAYAGYVRSDSATFSFENYKLTSPEGWHVFKDGALVTKGTAHTGDYAIRFDRDEVNSNGYRFGYLQLGDNKTAYDLNTSKKYVVTFKYYVEKNGTKDASVSFQAGHRTSLWHNSAGLTSGFKISSLAKTGVWQNGALIVDATKCKEGSNYIFVCLGDGNDGIYYIDDITLTVLPEGHTGYVVSNGGCDSIPLYVTGAMGSSFYNKLPKNPVLANHLFKGYTLVDASGNEEEFTAEKAVFSDKNVRIRADFVRINTVQNFDEESFGKLVNYYAAYSALDYDWEYYDSKAEGNSADNVTSGRYSLHRKGNTMFFEAAQILTQDKLLSVGERYTITMKVKLGKHLQTDGAIKFASCRSPYYPWATMGDRYPIVAIADLVDGEWHEVSYTFNAVEALISINTPGYCEIFVDDVVITRVDDSVPLSTPVKFTEYVPAKRDEFGNLVETKLSDIDITTIIDSSLTKIEDTNYTLYIIIGAGAVVLIAAAAVLVIILKKRKAKKV